MVDNAALRETIRPELSSLGLSEDEELQMVEVINLLACLLIDATSEDTSKEIPHDNAN